MDAAEVEAWTGDDDDDGWDIAPIHVAAATRVACVIPNGVLAVAVLPIRE